MTSIDNLRRVDPGYKTPRGKISFSRTEIIHITVALVVLSLAFTHILYRAGNVLYRDEVVNILALLAISAVLVFCSFILHEFGHKFVAQRFNAWSEFRIFPMGLVMALLSSLMGFLFAAPGAVYIRGQIDKEMNGKISLAGPGVNFVISAIALVLCFLMGPGSVAYFVIASLAYLNAFLGLFNMIPVLPFDGSKIIAWDIRIYLLTVAVGAVELAAYLFCL
jgi:Zn-dependent protease